MPDYQKLMFNSKSAGLAQKGAVSFSVSVPSISWASGASSTFTASAAMAGTNVIPDTQVRLTGLSSKWFWLSPLAGFSYPDGTTAATSDMEVTMTAYFTGSTLNVRIFMINNGFTTLTRPAFTVDCQGYIDEAPF